MTNFELVGQFNRLKHDKDSLEKCVSEHVTKVHTVLEDALTLLGDKIELEGVRELIRTCRNNVEYMRGYLNL